MEVTITETSAEEILVSFKGKLDTMASRQVSNDVEPVMSLLKTTRKNVTLDFSELTYIASAGIRIILLLQKATLTIGSQLVIKGMVPSVREVFEITGLDRSINIW